MKIVGLTGFAKSGKSTAAEILRNLGGQEVAFAKHLKDVCSVVLCVPRDHFDDQAFKEVAFEHPRELQKNDLKFILEMFEVPTRYLAQAILSHKGVELKSPRHVAQYIGTEVLRTIDTDIHIKMAFKLNTGKSDGFLVCSDVRFANELAAVQGQGGIVLGISRKAVVPADLVNLHPSEKEIPSLIEQANFTVENETSIANFQSNVKSLAQSYLSR